MIKNKVVVICGATGVGKTHCAISLALLFGGEIIGADAVQVYRKLEIGSAKPTIEERSEVRHHLIDLVDPSEDFDAARYVQLARQAMDGVFTKGGIPFIVGGTGLYIKAVLSGLFQSPPTDPEIRTDLRKQISELGSAVLHDELRRLDPVSADRIHPNDSTRILRALEVVLSTGASISSFQRTHGFSDSPYESYKIGLFMDREHLYRRIEIRVDQMIADGFIREVEGLLASGYGPEVKAMQTLGYRHIAKYLTHEMDLETAVSMMKRDHRRYAKRQMTWFRADPDVKWFSPEDIPAMENGISAFLGR